MKYVNMCQYSISRGALMLGIEDPQIWIAYILCIAGAISCMIYGIIKWNDGEENEVCP
ncbi:MAG: hypothetical protein AWU58_2101 [Methanohalophilus sp. T328-1]|nr:MAG: hypothetical protein AWU58_2101 [Methanohalophilus sp. T328-1]